MARGQRNPHGEFEKNLKHQISENLIQISEAKGYKQIDIARGTGLTPSTLTSYFKGTTFPHMTNILKIAKFLEVDVAELDPRIRMEGHTGNHSHQTKSLAYNMSKATYDIITDLQIHYAQTIKTTLSIEQGYVFKAMMDDIANTRRVINESVAAFNALQEVLDRDFWGDDF
jgi:transcriptional regulator with XRE-family HTH domain